MIRSADLDRVLKGLERHLGAPGFVYFIGEAPDGPVKIGLAAEPGLRLGDLQVGNPRTLELLGGCPGGFGAERLLQAEFAEHRIRGEWFERTALLNELIRYWAGYNLTPRLSECCGVLVVHGRCHDCGGRAA